MIDAESWMREHQTQPAHFCALDTWGWSVPWCQTPRVDALPATVYEALQHGRAAGTVPGTLEAGDRLHVNSRQWTTREAAVAALAAALDELGVG